MMKLTEALGTKFFHKAYAPLVKNILDQVDEIDTAGARIAFDVMQVIQQCCWEGSVIVRDTENPKLDTYYSEQRRRGELHRKCEEIHEDMYPPRNVESIISYIKELDPDTLYFVIDVSSPLWYSYVFLVQAFRPEIKIEIGSGLKTMFTAIYSELFPTKKRWDEFYVLVGTTFEIRRPTPEEYDDFVRSNIVVPTAFGRDEIAKCEEWNECFSRMANILRKELQPQYHKISDYLNI